MESAIVKKLFLEGKIVTVNEEISYEAAEEIAAVISAKYAAVFNT